MRKSNRIPSEFVLLLAVIWLAATVAQSAVAASDEEFDEALANVLRFSCYDAYVEVWQTSEEFQSASEIEKQDLRASFKKFKDQLRLATSILGTRLDASVVSIIANDGRSMGGMLVKDAVPAEACTAAGEELTNIWREKLRDLAGRTQETSDEDIAAALDSVVRYGCYVGYIELWQNSEYGQSQTEDQRRANEANANQLRSVVDLGKEVLVNGLGQASVDIFIAETQRVAQFLFDDDQPIGSCDLAADMLVAQWSGQLQLDASSTPSIDDDAAIEEATDLHETGVRLMNERRLDEAEAALRSALEIFERVLGPESEEVGIAAGNLGLVLFYAGRHDEAVDALERAAEIGEVVHGTFHPSVATSLVNLAGLYMDLTRHDEAETALRRALDIREAAFGTSDPSVAKAHRLLGDLYRARGDYSQAVAELEQARDIDAQSLPTDHPDRAVTLNSLAGVYNDVGRSREAEPLYLEAIRIATAAYGEADPRIITFKQNLAVLYSVLGRYAEGEERLLQSLADAERAFGQDHATVGKILMSLGGIQNLMRRHHEAERNLRRAIDVLEHAYGPVHPDVAMALSNLAQIYVTVGRSADGERLASRAIYVFEQLFGLDNDNIAAPLGRLAGAYILQGRHADAEASLRRALTIREAALGPNHPRLASTLNNLAEVERALLKIEEAAAHYQRALEIAERFYGGEAAPVAAAHNNLGLLHAEFGNKNAAILHFSRAIEIDEAVFGPDNPEVAIDTSNLALTYFKAGYGADALTTARRATEILSRRYTDVRANDSDALADEQRSMRGIFFTHMMIAANLDGRDAGAVAAETFEVAQYARNSSVARIIANMGARFAAGENDLARIVRERQDAVEKRRRFDTQLLDAASQPEVSRDGESESAIRAHITTLNSR